MMMMIIAASFVAPLPNRDMRFPSCPPPSITTLNYLSPINNSCHSYVILYIMFPSGLGSLFVAFLEFTECGDSEILFHLVLSSILLALLFHHQTVAA
jgi:hypothetical protein